MGASPTSPSKDTAEKTPLLACPTCFNPLLPLAPSLRYSNKPHWAKTTPDVTSNVHCLSVPSLGSAGAPALASPTRKWSPAGKIPRISLRRDLAELEAKVKEALALKGKKNHFVPKRLNLPQYVYFLLRYVLYFSLFSQALQK